MTPSEREHAERLVWTQDKGRGWRPLVLASNDTAVLLKLQAELESRLAPTDRVTIIGMLARLANHFWSERPADSWEMLFDDYANDLAEISAAHLREIIDWHRREKAWFPKVSELIECWSGIKCGEGERLRRIRVAIGDEPKRAWE